jgi:hypothetical protein
MCHPSHSVSKTATADAQITGLCSFISQSESLHDYPAAGIPRRNFGGKASNTSCIIMAAKINGPLEAKKKKSKNTLITQGWRKEERSSHTPVINPIVGERTFILISIERFVGVQAVSLKFELGSL